ncbi:MAG: hypothetical protein RLZZ401_550 [Pseudomonadota bacterium]|jgi:uncharacterized protein YgbK (DUF1537 family)
MLKLGCIADDFATATDVANNLVAAGMRVVLTRSVPQAPLEAAFADADAVVVALTTRLCPPPEAVLRTLNALVWLKAEGALQIYFAFSPTFDSRYAEAQPGNIGPVIDALMGALQTNFTLVCPAFPELQCTVFKGHLFVGDALLHESGMQNHPLTPMADASLLRVLGAQTQKRIDRIDQVQVAESSVAIQERMVQLRLQHVEIALADACSTDDLLRLGAAIRGMPLLAASPGIALGLPQNFDILPTDHSGVLPLGTGFSAVVCGSCSEVSAEQVQKFHALGHPAMAIDPLKVAKFGAARVAQAAATWAAPLLKRGPVMLYSTADAKAVQSVQSLLGIEDSAKLVSHCLAETACALVQSGVRQLIVGGSTTSQWCAKGLGLSQLRVGTQIDPGAFWCYANQLPPLVPGSDPPHTEPDPNSAGLHICFKPGNAGADDFFVRAFDMLR